MLYIGPYEFHPLTYSRPRQMGCAGSNPLPQDMPQTTHQMIATALCPQCRMRVWLLDAVRFIPGAEPDSFEGPDPVTFPHCGKTQSVPAASILYKRSTVTEFGESA